MRPKKVIVYVDSSEVRLSIVSFVLRTREFEVLTAECQAETIKLLRDREDIRLVMASREMIEDDMGNRVDGEQMLGRVRQLFPDVQVLSLDWETPWTPGDPPSGRVSMTQPEAMAFLLPRVKVLANRQRGPKKQSKPANESPAKEMTA